MKALVAWFTQNSMVANLLLLAILASGVLNLSGLRQEVFPEVSLDLITVGAKYRGAGPEEVEAAVCIRLEEAVQGIEGIRKITSRASEGSGSMTIEIGSRYDVRQVMEEVKANVDAIETFPADVDKPIIKEVVTRFRVISVAVSGETDLATLKRMGERVRDELTALPEISLTELRNSPPYEISIEVSEEALRRWALTFDEIADAIRRFSVDLPGGSLKTDGGEVLLRTEGQAYTGDEYERLPLLIQSDGTKVHLRDVAEVVDGFADVALSARFDGKPSVVVQVYSVGDQSAISVADAVHKYVAAAAPSMPAGIQIATWQDNARLLRGRIDLLVKNALSGLVLVFVVVALFMRLRLAFWVTVGIPVSFLGTIALMPVLGVSINMMSLFAFILVLGIVVDDAIVVGENIHVTQTRTGERKTAAIQATCEVLVPVTFGVLTTMVAFTPMLFVSGVMANIMVVFPLIILPTLFFSLVESQLVLPSHLGHAWSPRKRPVPGMLANRWNAFFEGFSNGLNWFVRQVYRPLLSASLEWRYLTLAAALFCVQLTIGLVGAGHVRLLLLPAAESDNVVAFLAMPQDVQVEATADAVARIERRAMELRNELSARYGQDLFRHVMTSVGEQPFREFQLEIASVNLFPGPHLGEVNIELVPAEERAIASEQIASLLRDKVGQIPGAVELTIVHDLIGGEKAIDLQFTAPDIDTLRHVAQTAKAQLAEYPGVIEVTDTYEGGKPEIKLRTTSEGEAAGLTTQDLGRQVRQGFFGEQAQRIQRGPDDIRVMVRYPRRDRRSLGNLEQMRIRTPSGDELPFSTVAVASIGRGPASITRVERRRSINVRADVDRSITTGSDVVDALRSEFLPQMMRKHPEVTYSFEGEEASFAESIEGLSKGFVAALFAMFALLAIPLKSYLKPMIVLSAVPFGMVGAIWGHWILDMEVSVISMCGMVALAGIVVNDSLVMVTFINSNIQKQGSLRGAVRLAGEARFRAIVLTSLTTVAGVTPLLLEQSLQAQFLIPMAVALAAGVLFSTVVTLILVPTLYLILEDLRDAVRWWAGDTAPRA